MKHTPSPLRTHLEGDVRTPAACLKITTTTGQIYGFTSHQNDITMGDILYKATPGFTAGSMVSRLEAGDAKMDLEFLVTPEIQVLLNLLQDQGDKLKLAYSIVNYRDPAAGQMLLRTGYIGTVQVQAGLAVVEFLSITQRLDHEFGQSYSPDCRANLGDARCRVNLDSYIRIGEVIENQPKIKITTETPILPIPYVAVTWISGENQGISLEIKEFDKNLGSLTFFLPLSVNIAIGDKFKLIPGCDKSLGTCGEIYKNTNNFRGEPFIPV